VSEPSTSIESGHVVAEGFSLSNLAPPVCPAFAPFSAPAPIGPVMVRCELPPGHDGRHRVTCTWDAEDVKYGEVVSDGFTRTQLIVKLDQ
jgi:hypothetical protein